MNALEMNLKEQDALYDKLKARFDKIVEEEFNEINGYVMAKFASIQSVEVALTMLSAIEQCPLEIAKKGQRRILLSMLLEPVLRGCLLEGTIDEDELVEIMSFVISTAIGQAKKIKEEDKTTKEENN